MRNLSPVTRWVGASLATALLAAVTIHADVRGQETTQYASPGFTVFQQRVEAYALLHRNLAASLPPLGSRIDRQSVVGARKFLASAIRAARPNARQGDIFTTEATIAFRNVIVDTTRPSDFGMFASMMDENGRFMPGAHPRVYEAFPALESSELPPLVLSWLPTLPEELEYRLVDYDLVLWDVYADLVVDVIPYALAHPWSDVMYR